MQRKHEFVKVVAVSGDIVSNHHTFIAALQSSFPLYALPCRNIGGYCAFDAVVFPFGQGALCGVYPVIHTFHITVAHTVYQQRSVGFAAFEKCFEFRPIVVTASRIENKGPILIKQVDGIFSCVIVAVLSEGERTVHKHIPGFIAPDRQLALTQGVEFRRFGEIRQGFQEYIRIEVAAVIDRRRAAVGSGGENARQSIFPTGSLINPIGANIDIDAEYAIDIWKKLIGNTATYVTASSKTPTSTTRKYKRHPEIPKEFLPSDLALFEKELLDKKKAKITLTYADGHTTVYYWDARKYKSDLKASVYCQLRDKPDRDHIVKAVFEV